MTTILKAVVGVKSVDLRQFQGVSSLNPPEQISAAVGSKHPEARLRVQAS